MGTGQADIGLCIAATALNGYQGAPPYAQSFGNLRTLIASFQLGYLQMAVLEESSLQSVKDIQGHRVGLGPAGHGSIPRQREIYQEMGVSFEDFTPIYLPFRDSLQSLGDRRLDAAVLYMAPPAPSLIEFGVTNQFRLLPLELEYRERLVEKYPYFVPKRRLIRLPRRCWSTWTSSGPAIPPCRNSSLRWPFWDRCSLTIRERKDTLEKSACSSNCSGRSVSGLPAPVAGSCSGRSVSGPPASGWFL